jgi:two-component system, LytTR family, response regulator
MALRTVIIDDEVDSLELLQYKIKEYCPDLCVVGYTQTPEDAKELINDLQPDVVFLDVEMPRMNGFSLLNELGPITFEVIFTTAYSHYAIDAVRVSAFDYLTKPISIQDLERCVSRLLSKRGDSINYKSHTPILEKAESIIVIPTIDSIEFIKIADIILLEASGNYTNIFFTNGKNLLVSKSLGEYEGLLVNHQFFRSHNSALINIKHIVKYQRDDGGHIVMTNNRNVPISRRKKEEFMELMKRMSI